MPVPREGSGIADKPKSAKLRSVEGQTTDQAATPATPAVVPAAVNPTVRVPKRRRWLWALSVLLAAGLSGALYLQPWSPAVTEVAVEVVTSGPVTRVLAVNGRIAGVQSVDVRPQVAGTLADVLVDEGDVVEVGAAMARIDPASQEAVVRQARAGLDAARLAEAEVRATYARTKALGTNVARVVLETAERSVQTALQEVARMTALLDQAEIQLAKYTIRAPLSGTVLVQSAEPGQFVDLASELMTIVDLGQLIVETDVDEAYATQIRVDQPAVLQLAGESTVRDGRISFVSQRVDEATGGLAVELTPATPLTAPIGLTVTANITVDVRPAAITVPRAAIVRDATGDGVLVVAGGVAERRPVAVIDWPAARLIVTEGLAVGDVVIGDATGVVAGAKVAVKR